METMKWCKHCEVHHPTTSEYWEFRKERPYRCKAWRRKQYHELGGKEKAADKWANITPEEIDHINALRKRRYKRKVDNTEE